MQSPIDSYCSLQKLIKLTNFFLTLAVFLSLSQADILNKIDRTPYRMARLLQLLSMWAIVLLHIQNVKTDVRKPCGMVEDWFPSGVEPQTSTPPYVLDVIRQRDGKSVRDDMYQNKGRYDWHEKYTSNITFFIDYKFLSREICTRVHRKRGRCLYLRLNSLMQPLSYSLQARTPRRGDSYKNEEDVHRTF